MIEHAKPCPFCGSTDLAFCRGSIFDPLSSGMFIRCRACGAAGPNSKEQDTAILYWNCARDYDALNLEADWLADKLSCACSVSTSDNCGIPIPCPNTTGCMCLDVEPKDWREAARKAVEEQCKQ